MLEKENDPRVVTVSSAGMLIQKLNTCDLQWERAAFDGTMVYSQNKRQQVVMTEQWARMYPTIHFSSMHPGWADTPDRKPVPKHIPLARTSSSPVEEEKLMKILEEMAQRFK